MAGSSTPEPGDTLNIRPRPMVTAQWYGINQYMFYNISDTLVGGMRLEWFRDNNGTRVLNPIRNYYVNGPYATGYAGNFWQATWGLNWKPNNNWIIRPELRYDWYSPDDPNGNLPFGKIATGPGDQYGSSTAAATRSGSLTFPAAGPSMAPAALRQPRAPPRCARAGSGGPPVSRALEHRTNEQGPPENGGPCGFLRVRADRGSVSTGQCPACLAVFWPLRDFLRRDVSPTATESVGGFGKLRNLHKAHSFAG